MSQEMMAFILIGGFVLLLVIGAEVFVAIGVMATVGLLLFVDQGIAQLAFIAFDVANSFALTALPLFILMGTLFSTTGIIANLLYGVEKVSRELPGGVAASVIVTNAIFGAMSGSQLAAAAVFGKSCYPPMEKMGYDTKLTLGSIAVGGTLAGIIPPSFLFIVYGVWQDVSIARLFAAGLIPGIIGASLFLLLIVVRVKINPRLAPKPPPSTGREKLTALLGTLPFIAVIFLVLGTIFLGIMTPTESASLGAFLSIVLALAYRKMSFSALKEAMRSAVVITSMVLFIMFMARALSVVFQYLGVIDGFLAFMLDLPFGKYGTFAIISIMYLIMGMFIDSTSMLVLTLPFVGPLILALGFNTLWFGVVFAVLASIGLVTPPFGLTLFVLHSVLPQHDVMTIARGCIPFLIPLLALVVLLTALPEVVLWLPRIMF